MTIQIALLFVIILAMIVVMALEKLPTDTLAVTVMVVLILGGFVTPEQGIAGLSNPATVTILALMILTVGLETTGVINAIGRRLKNLLNGKEWKTMLVILFIAGSCSALISTTAIVIVFMRVLISLSKKLPLRLSRFLMPLSFAGILGGSCTLLGTSTNLLVSSIAKEHGLPAFDIFEFTHIGAIFFVSGLAYILLVGRHLIPIKEEDVKSQDQDFIIHDYLTEVRINSQADFAGETIGDSPFKKNDELEIIEITRRGKRIYFPKETESLELGDRLLIKASVEILASINRIKGISLFPRHQMIESAQDANKAMAICEVIVKSNSPIIGTRLDRRGIPYDDDAKPIGIKKHRGYFRWQSQSLTIEPGDTLLMKVDPDSFERFYNRSEFFVLQERDDLAAKNSKRFLTALIMVSVILLAAFNVLTILESALAGCVVMFLTGCLKLQKAYRRVEWNVFFLLAGVIPLGTAMNNTGASDLIASTFVESFGLVSPRMLVALLYISTNLFSAVISNNATAILFAPIAISIAMSLNIDPRPLLLTIMFAANMSFITPLGYQTNALVYGVGEYRFVDFFKVGGLLSLLIGILATLLIPYFYF